MSVPPYRRVPFFVTVGDLPAQLVGYLDRRALEADSDAALVSILRDVANEIERQVDEERGQ
ncbi:hypothetical protein V1227_18725 [Lentzea sp. DG1S-22]|uniref:hypothetical protein n=1 Tax=Lentzea sp. DG1S-22 TaxID=3108822 RepID=UPI002E78C817|nr:hypothetical protein [Lentzea sp. DG1S-22]WVH84690.1 hypothetical protein V1227_18725 [Lentzea sp. DG1S-22]